MAGDPTPPVFWTDMYQYLIGQSAFTDIMASSPDTRIYPNRRPQEVGGTTTAQSTRPYIVARMLTDAPLHHFGSAVGHSESTWQFDCCAHTVEKAFIASEALRNELDGFQGQWNSSTQVRRCHLILEVQDFIPDGVGAESGTFVVTQDYEIAYVRSVPTFA